MKRDPETDALNVFALARDFLHIYMPTVRGLAVKTIEAYRIGLECFMAFLTTSEDLDRYAAISHRANTGSPRMAMSIVQATRSVCASAADCAAARRPPPTN